MGGHVFTFIGYVPRMNFKIIWKLYLLTFEGHCHKLKTVICNGLPDTLQLQVHLESILYQLHSKKWVEMPGLLGHFFLDGCD